MKKLLATALLILTSCSGNLPKSNVPAKQTQEIVQQKPRRLERKQQVQSINIPEGWLYISDANDIPQPPSDLKIVLLAQSPYNIGNFPIQFAIMTTLWDDHESFGAVMSESMKTQVDEFFESNTINVNDCPGTVMSFRLSDYVVLQANIEINDVGIILNCKGDLNEKESVLVECHKIISTFTSN